MQSRAEKMLDLVGLGRFAERYPRELSGGQQQRVALARGLVFNPDVLLLDEPLGALDKNLREQMQVEIKRIHREIGITMIYVTHDQTEAMTMSDRVAVFSNGKVEQIGSPLEVYNRPANRFVGQFIGDSNFFAGHVDPSRPNWIELVGIGPVRVATNAALPPGDVDLMQSILTGLGSGGRILTLASGTALPRRAASSSRGRYPAKRSIRPLIRSCGPVCGMSCTTDETSTTPSPVTTPSL